MPIEETANYIRVRVESPSGFSRFRVKELGSGTKAVIGFMKGGGSKIQSILFPRDRYDMKSAKSWIKTHGYTIHECLLVNDIIIDPKSLDLTFIEEVVTEVEEEKVARPKKNPWDWLLDDDLEWTL